MYVIFIHAHIHVFFLSVLDSTSKMIMMIIYSLHFKTYMYIYIYISKYVNIWPYIHIYLTILGENDDNIWWKILCYLELEIIQTSRKQKLIYAFLFYANLICKFVVIFFYCCIFHLKCPVFSENFFI